jgi:peptidoglycan/LPS O-acetylase OafA/YrhL
MDGMTRDTPVISTRTPTLDGLKFVAASFIVLLHVAGTHGATNWTLLTAFTTSVTYVALYFFFGVSGYLHGTLGKRGPQWLGRRILRLMVPYAVWNAIYFAWESYRGMLFSPWLTHEVLWSLPMLVVFAVLAEATISTPPLRRGLLVLLGIVAVATSLLAPIEWQCSPWRQFLFGARWPFMYVVGMEIRALPQRALGATPWLAAGFLAILTGLLGIVDTSPYPFPLYSVSAVVAYSGVTALLLFAIRAGDRSFGTHSLRWGGPYLLGIYVSHYLWLELLVDLLPPGPFSAWLWVPLAWASVLAASLGTTALLYHFKYTRIAVA